MAFNASLLLNQLLNTGLSVKDNPQYQLLKLMIDDLTSINKSLTAKSSTPAKTIVNNIIQSSIAPIEEFDDYGFVPSSSFHTGGGTATQVAFWTSPTSLGSDSNLFWDNVNKRLGVGSIATPGTPTSQLDVGISDTGIGSKDIILTIERTGGSSVDGTPREVGLVFKDSSNSTLVAGITGNRENAAGNYLGGLNIYVHNTSATPATTFADLTQVIWITSATNVGIGVAPSYKLSIAPTGTIGLVDGSGPTYDSLIEHTALSPFRTLQFTSFAGTGLWRGEIKFLVNYNAGSRFSAIDIIANTDGISANTGINIANPVAFLDVRTTRASGANSIALVLSDPVTGIQTVGFGNSIQWWSNSGSSIAQIAFEVGGTGTNNESQISFYTQNVAGGLGRKVVIDSSGFVGIGVFPPTQVLDLSGNFRVSNASTIFGVGQLFIRAGATGTGTLELGAGNSNSFVVLFPSQGMNFGSSNAATDPGVSIYKFNGNGTTPVQVFNNSGAFGLGTRGSTWILGNNTSGAGAPGCIEFIDRNTATFHFVFADTNSVLHILDTSPPVENGGACDLVGQVIHSTHGFSRVTGQTAGVGPTTLLTVPAFDCSYYVSANLNITAYTSGSLTTSISYTDETNTARSINFGAVTGVNAFPAAVNHIRCKASTTITYSVGGTFVATYNVEAEATRIQ